MVQWTNLLTFLKTFLKNRQRKLKKYTKKKCYKRSLKIFVQKKNDSYLSLAITENILACNMMI